INYITNTGKFGLSMSDKVKSVLLNAKNYNKSDEEILHLLVRELQYVDGRTLANTIPRNGIK
ncbi:TPA: hypothetical protein ACWYFL_003463, partial [Proteus mirabilis]